MQKDRVEKAVLQSTRLQVRLPLAAALRKKTGGARLVANESSR